MTDDAKKDLPTTTEVSVNWEGLKRFLGWRGTTTELKKVELDRSGEPLPARSRTP